MQARSIDVPTVTANIFETATNRTNILNKTGTNYMALICLYNEMSVVYKEDYQFWRQKSWQDKTVQSDIKTKSKEKLN